MKTNLRTISSAILFLLLLSNGVFAQNTPTTQMLDNALTAVVTVAVYQTDVAMKPMGFRGKGNELAYSKALDLTGAKGSGSGFVVKHNGKMYVITNAHVVQDAASTDGSIYVYSVGYKKYAAKVVGGDSFYDIAVLEFTDNPGSEITDIKFRAAEARVGEQVFAIGNPLGDYPYTVTDGIISAKNRVRGGLTGKFGFLQSTATVIWGNSGGPLVDANGDVVGINSQIAFATQGQQQIWQPQINFALEAPLSERLVNDIIDNAGLVKRAYIGVEISCQKVDSYYRQVYGSNNSEVNPLPVISAVIPGSPAASTLAQYVGAIVQSVNGETVRSVEEALGILEKATPGDDISFSLKKGQQVFTAKVKAETTNETTTAAISKYAVKQWGCKSAKDNNNLSLSFVDRVSYANFQQRATESISNIGKDNQLPKEVLFSNDWIVVAAGILSRNGNSVWKVQDDADLGSALRLSGPTGVVDLVLFKKGSDPSNERNYIQKRFLLSGKDYVYKQTLWY